MQYYYEDVPGLGNVALSRHAQAKAEDQGITDGQISLVLYRGKDIPDSDSIMREHIGIRLVIITPTPFRGAKLVKTLYRVEPQARV
jgi:hypothetical protein